MNIALITLPILDKLAVVTSDNFDVQALKLIILIEFLIILILGFRLIRVSFNFHDLINLKIKKETDKSNNEMIILKEYKKS